MRWNTLGTFVLFLGTVSWCQSIETQDHAPSADKTYHFPTASLTIAGDLKDVKLKGTIAQLVRALQQPTSSSVAAAGQPKETPEPKPKTTISSGTKKIIHPSQLITKHNIASNHKFGKTLFFGDPVPDTITVSSQSVKVKQANSTGGKRSRHLQAFIGNHPSAVRTLEGVRVPDDEADKHYTWRNARVIKGFLVPNGKPANPHKKRQVIITDPQQYLAAAAAAQAQGATTIIDHGSSTANNGQPRTSVFYAQEPAHQGLSGGGPSASNSNNGASILNFANDPSQQRSHPQVVYPNQQQTHQTTNNGQNSAFSYNTPQQNTHSMYVLQDGSAYMQQYNANQAAPSTHQQHQAQLVQQQSQSQFFSRSGEASTAPVGSQVSQQQQHGSVNSVTASPIRAQQQQPLTAAIKQQYQPSLDTQAIQAAVEAVQQLEAQQQAAQQSANQQSFAGQLQQQQQQQQAQIQAGQQIQIPGLLQQGQQIQIAQGSSPSQTLVLPQGISGGGATAQEILAATAAATNGQVTAQYIQIQPSQEQSLIQQLQQQQPQQAQQQYPAANQFAERQNYQTNQQPAQYVIQPHTYVSNAGGPHFTVPIPVPVEQTVLNQQQLQQPQQTQQQHQQIQQQQQQIQQQGRHHGQNQHHGNSQTQHHGNNQNQHHANGQNQHHGNGNHHNQYQQQQHGGNNGNSNNRHLQQGQQSSIGDRMKQVFNQNFNRKMLERVETNAVVPALASTGLFLGLSALAAGWYLSKNNREVGIVRRTGKFSKKSGKAAAPAIVSSDFPGLPQPEKEEKEGTPNVRTRRDLASMVTPQNYNPSGAPEVDQATFFQSIIQQSLEKTQKDYEDTPVEPLYQQQPQDNYGGSSHDSGPVYRGDPEPERHGPPSHSMPPQQTRQRSKYNRYNDKPVQKYSNSRDDDYYDSPAASRISKSQQIQEKSGWSVHSAKNFARVAIPAIVLTGAAIGICAVIFGWYISGDNREIAFLESPATQTIGGSASYRKKRSLFGSSSNAAWSDGWLIRTLKAIHGNPYDNMPAPTAKSFVPYPYFLDKDSSKTSTMEFKVSNNGLAGVLAGGAVLAVVALGLINSFSESSGRNLKTARYNHLLTHSASAAKALTNSNSKASTNPLTHLRAPRTMAAHFDNDLEFQEAVSSPSFFESIISSLEASGDTIMNKLHDMGSSNWQKSSCTKRILCTVVTSQGDDTVRIMEKKLASVLKMLPESVSSSINNNYNDVLSSIYKRDCSAFTCSSTKKPAVSIVYVKSTNAVAASSSSHHHKESSSIKVDQTVTNNSR